MKICVFTDSFLPYISGVTTAVISQTSELAKRGHDITIFSPNKKKDITKRLHRNIKVIDIPFSFPAPNRDGLNIALPSVVKTARLLRKFKPDIIHVHTEFGSGWEGLICSKIFRIPILGSFHTFFADPGYLKNINAPDSELLQRLVWSYSISFLNQCDMVVTPSNVTKKELKEHRIKKVPKIISNGIEIPKLKSKKEIKELKKKYNLPDCPHLMYVGRVSVEKSLDIAINAYRIVLNDYPDVKFIIIGDGPYMDKLKEIIKEHNLKEKVILLGKVEHKRLIKDNLFRLGDIFVTASKTETQGISVLEAMSLGLPVVGVREKGIAELVEHEHNGLLAKADDFIEMSKHINTLIRNPETLDTLSKNALKSANKHDIKKICDKFETIYKKLVREKKTNYKKRLSVNELKNSIREKLSYVEKKIFPNR